MQDPHPILPMCGVCAEHSAIFSVVEHYDTLSRTLVLCRHCFQDRALLWERYVLHAQVTQLDRRYKSS